MSVYLMFETFRYYFSKKIKTHHLHMYSHMSRSNSKAVLTAKHLSDVVALHLLWNYVSSCFNVVVLGHFLSALSASLRITTCYRHSRCKLITSSFEFFA